MWHCPTATLLEAVDAKGYGWTISAEKRKGPPLFYSKVTRLGSLAEMAERPFFTVNQRTKLC
jgi:hypothetical protein